MPRSSREKSAETRTQIIETAYSLFVQKGYNATSMREISQEAGLTVGAIYNHFATKEDIWIQIVDVKHPYHEIIPLILSIQGDTVTDVLRAAARTLVQYLSKRPDIFNMIFIELVEFRAAHVHDIYETIVPKLLPLRDILNDKKGHLRDIPTPILLRSFVGLFFSFYITGVMMKSMPLVTNDEAALDQFVNLYLAGILAEDDPLRQTLS
jgi:AcrR family transcriptional regulator